MSRQAAPAPRAAAAQRSRKTTPDVIAGPPIEVVLVRLRQVYGEMPWRPHGDALSELVLTILSQHTSDTNSGRAFAELLRTFPDWDAIRTAEPRAVSAAIRAAGLFAVKGPRIQQVLQRIIDARCAYSLDFLRELPLAEARAWLLNLPGVGPKTAACVLLFALGLPALPVDTHVYRVAGRLGLLPAKATPETAHAILEAAVTPAQVYPLHIGLIKHGRHTCHARSPRCDACVLADICPAAPAG